MDALCDAVARGDISFLASAADFDVNRSNSDGNTPLVVAVEHERRDVLAYLYTVPGFDPNVEYGDCGLGATVLWRAAGDNTPVDVFHSLVVDGGADVNRQNSCDGEAPLHCVAAYGNIAKAQLLLSRPELDLDVLDDIGNTAEDWAEEIGHYDVVELIAEEVCI